LYVHYSPRRVDVVQSLEQESIAHFKPNGLWITIEGEDGWKDWCENNDWSKTSLKFAHDVLLSNDAKILRISSAADIYDLTDRYTPAKSRDHPYSMRMIEWKRVAKDYQGILIVPYIWSERLSETNRWYYAWDCASGCIWDADAIESIRVRAMESTP
jgi:hypothetical protein